MSKLCPHCKIVLDDIMFYRNKQNKNGLDSWCKKCTIERVTFSKNHPKEANHRRKPTIDGNLFCCVCNRELSKESFYTSKHNSIGFSYICKECESLRAKNRRIEHHEQFLEREHEFLRTHAESERLRKLDYFHRVKRTERYLCRKHIEDSKRRKYGNYIKLLTPETIKFFLVLENNTCPACGKEFSERFKYTIDHVIPLSKGGDHSLGNIQLLCNHCNCVKHTKSVRYIPEIFLVYSDMT